MVTKVAGGIIGLGLISTGSVAIAKPEWFGINKEIPWTPLSQDKDFSDSDGGAYKDKFGSTYKNYLTGVKGKENKSNNSWWEESFKKLKEDKAASASLGNEFKETITGAVKPSGETGGNKYLNEICDTIYKLGKEKVKPTPETTANDEYKESEVWKYCSGLGEKPKTVEEVDKDKYKDNDKTLIGKDTSDRQKLISTTGNDKFWEIREKEFRGKHGYDKIEGNDSEDKFFSTSKNKDIITLCGEAYGLEATSNSSSEANKPTKSQTLKYCSLDKSAQ